MMAKKSKIDEDCEELNVVADPWYLKRETCKTEGGSPFFDGVKINIAPWERLGMFLVKKIVGKVEMTPND